MKGTEKVDRTIDAYLTSLGLASVLTQVRLIRAWADVVGPLLAGKTFPARLRNGVLTIHVLNHSWSQELHLRKPELIEKVRETLGKESLRDIRFAVGPVPAADVDAPAPPGSVAPPSLADPEGMESVADPETRAILRAIARKAASRRK